MKFLCVGYFVPAKMDSFPKDEMDAVMQKCPPHMDTLYDTNKVVMVAGVDAETRYLRHVGGEVSVLDHDTEERPAKIGCVFLIEAADIDEATRLASLHPTTQVAAGEQLGWYTEVRRVHYFYADGSQSDRPIM